jgi:long-chain acyl-CoA synthetase
MNGKTSWIGLFVACSIGVCGAAAAAQPAAPPLPSLSRQNVPRSIDFEAELPRLPTGKLYKRLLRDRYWGDRTSRIL